MSNDHWRLLATDKAYWAVVGWMDNHPARNVNVPVYLEDQPLALLDVQEQDWADSRRLANEAWER